MTLRTTTALVFALFLAVALVTVAGAGPPNPATDTDGDTIPDVIDNCVLNANATQADADLNGCGDACEIQCDFDGNGKVEAPDFVTLSVDFGCTGGGCPGDCTGDGATTSPDFVALSVDFGVSNAGGAGLPGGLNGPGVSNVQLNTASCLQ